MKNYVKDLRFLIEAEKVSKLDLRVLVELPEIYSEAVLKTYLTEQLTFEDIETLSELNKRSQEFYIMGIKPGDVYFEDATEEELNKRNILCDMINEVVEICEADYNIYI